MPAAWSGSLGYLKQLDRTGSAGVQVREGFAPIYGAPTLSESESWRQSISALCSALTHTEFDSLQAILELQMPVGAERADVILLGGSPAKAMGYVLELKQWSVASVDSETQDVYVQGLGTHQHPSIQALNYRGRLRLFHERAASYNWATGAFLHNMPRPELRSLERASPKVDLPLVDEG
jgi:hypothetical protein